MKTLKSFIQAENQWRAIWGNKPLSLATAQDRQHIADIIDGKLSPENLTCDGELVAATVRRNFKFLTQAANELKQLDPGVKLYEC